MSLFGDLDIASAVDPNEIADGTYAAKTGGTKRQTTKNEVKKLVITYTIDDEESKYNGRKVTEWKTIPKIEDKGTADFDKDLGYLKQRLSSLGVPEPQMNTVEPEELDDIPVFIVVKNNDQYVNIQRVSLREELSGDLDLDKPNPFA